MNAREIHEAIAHQIADVTINGTSLRLAPLIKNPNGSVCETIICGPVYGDRQAAVGVRVSPTETDINEDILSLKIQSALKSLRELVDAGPPIETNKEPA